MLTVCSDVDECKHKKKMCEGDGAICENGVGSYTCKCKDGFKFDRYGEYLTYYCDLKWWNMIYFLYVALLRLLKVSLYIWVRQMVYGPQNRKVVQPFFSEILP